MRAIAVVVACALLAGCSELGVGRTTTPPSTRPRAQRTHEYPTPVPAQHASATHSDPVAAIRAFATTYINWSVGTVAARMRALAAASIGQARAAMQLAAAGTAEDYELHRGGIANSGVVEAIAPLRDSSSRYVVVTLERTTASKTTAYEGLRPAWHLAIATVTRTAAGQWVVSGWQPES